MSGNLHTYGSENQEKIDKGLIFNIQGCSLHDGPGIRTTVFMKGCSLRCEWCSNPESINPYPEIMLFDMRCIKCGKCVAACPRGAITIVDGDRIINWERCDQCLKCAEVCPTQAIERVGRYISQEELLKEIEKDKLFYKHSGGGVTFSGGEPLVQWEFLLGVLKKCKERGIHTALDTTLNIHWNILEKVLPYVDLVLCDVKHLNSEQHKNKTGVSNRLILENVRKMNPKYRCWLRVPIIPGYNDSNEYMKKLGEFAATLRVEKITLFPFHGLGEKKYESLGKVYSFRGVSAPKKEKMKEYQKTLQASGVEVTIGR